MGLEGVNFTLDALFHVAVAVVVIRAGGHTDGGRVFGLVAGLAVCGDFQSVGVVAGGAGVELAVVVELAHVGLARVFIDALGLGAEEGGPRGEVMHVAEAELIGDRVSVHAGDGLVDAGGALAALVAVQAQVVIRGFAKGDLGAGGEGDFLLHKARELGEVVVAGLAHQPVGGGHGGVDAFFDRLGQASAGVAFDAGARNDTVFVPMAEGFFRASEVAGVDAVGLGEVHRFGELGVQIFDRVIEQLDDVLAAVNVGARVLDGHLVVIGGLFQAGGPGGVLVGEDGLIRSRFAVFIGVNEEVGVGGRVIGDGAAGDLFGVGLDGGEEHGAQAVNFFGHAFLHIAVPVIIGGGGQGADLAHIRHGLD